MDPTFIAFLGVAIVVVMSPGPDMLLVMRNTLIGGRPGGAATVAGVTGGTVLWSLLAAFGVAAVLAASAVAFTALKLAGAAYLVYLGVAALRAGGSPHELSTPPPGTRLRAVRQGFLSAALNPKLGVFFLTLLPQFVLPGAPAGQLLALAGVFMVVGLVWLLVFVQLVDAFGAVLLRGEVRRRVQQATGVILIGLGLRVATER